MRWLFDTIVLSDARRKLPSSRVKDWIESLPVESVCSSSINIAELRYGAQIAPDSQRRLDITLWIDSRVRPMLAGRIFDVTENVLIRWRALSRNLELARKPAPAVDVLIAAVAIENALGVATRDVKPFLGTGVPVFNPWTGERFNGA